MFGISQLKQTLDLLTKHFMKHREVANANFEVLVKVQRRQAHLIEGIRVHFAGKGQELPPMEDLEEQGRSSLEEKAKEARAEEGSEETPEEEVAPVASTP